MASKNKTVLSGMPWTFDALWNEAIVSVPRRPTIKRDYIYASEIGGDFCSRYLKMHNHPVTNPPTERSRRKFVMGDITEWIVGWVLTMTGILKEKQMKNEVQLPGMLRVSGRLDFVAGGDIDWEKAKENVKSMKSLFASSIDDMPPVILHSVDTIINRFQQMFSRVPLREYIIECKSVSGLIMDMIERQNKPRPLHPLQILHYLIANKMQEGMLLYVCKDNAMCSQFIVTPTKELLAEYKNDIQTMTGYYNASANNYLKSLPPKSPEILFEPSNFTFRKNFQVEYSSYLTFLYGYKNLDDFKERWDKTISGWNAAFKRHVLEGKPTGKTGNPLKLTPGNIETIKEGKKYFPEWDKYVQEARKAGAFEKPEENEEE